MAGGKIHRPKPKRYRISAKNREFFTTNLSLLIHAAVPVGEAFASLQETTNNRTFKKALASMQADMEEGMPLWKTLEAHRIVPPQTLTIIRLGEETGNLPESLKVAAHQEEKQRLFRSKLRSALAYPLFVLVVAVVVGTGISWFLLPKLAETFSGLHVPLPLISRVMLNFGTFLKTDGVWAVPTVIGGVIALVSFLFFVPGTRSLGRRLVFHIPGVKRLVTELEIARFGYLFGTLLSAGLNVTESLKLLQDATTSPRYIKLYKYLAETCDNGESFKLSFARNPKTARVLPPAVRQMMIAAERSGALPETLLTVGEIYESKADVSTRNLETMIEPILLIVVWLGVLTIAVAVILPIYKMTGSLQVSK